MDFYRIRERTLKNGSVEVYPDFTVCRSNDLMVRGKSFYAIWDEEKGLWSTDEYDVQRLVDKELDDYADNVQTEGRVFVRHLGDFGDKSWREFRSYLAHLSDNAVQLDSELVWENTKVQKSDYVSKRLPYSLKDGDCSSFLELMSTLYAEEELEKLLWSIGAVVSGDSRHIQKFIVLYGSAGSGKSTVLNIIQKLFQGYYTTFEARALVGSSNAFATEAFKLNPLVAIQHDGDLSKIEDNTKLNSIVSHEEIVINEKYKPSYSARVNSFLFMGTNTPVKITDSKSGIIRRLIDVQPSGNKIPFQHYQVLMSRIEFELGAIAKYCLDYYLQRGPAYFDKYRPKRMMQKTDIFYNFVEDQYFDFVDGITLGSAYAIYKDYCDNALIRNPLPMYKFKDEFMNYFHEFHDRVQINGERVRSWYSGFKVEMFEQQEPEDERVISISFDSEDSLIDELYADCPAQYSSDNGTPSMRWADVSTTLKDIDTSREHYVRIPENHIVIDFDLKDESGNKSVERNLEEASKWPPTYGEYSKSGSGVHLHYIYNGDVSELARLYSDGVEIKVFTGLASLRRRLSRCNTVDIREIEGLPKKETKVIDRGKVASEKGLRSLVERNLRKEIHPGTKPSIDFIYKILEDAYSDGIEYDLRDMRQKVLTFAMNSTNQSEYCVKLVAKMKFKSADEAETDPEGFSDDSKLVFFDCEVFPNLFLVNWKYHGSDNIVRMINPEPYEIEKLFDMKLVGFNNRRYDNFMLYGRFMGYNNEQLYRLSKGIIENSKNTGMSEAYNISYTDVYDFANTKMSLKKWEIELGIHHKELGLPWDEPVPEEKWVEVAEYCDHDVIATEAVFEHLREDWIARQVLAELSGLTVNHSTNQHTARIIFGKNKHPQDQFVYTDLSKEFPGYKYDFGRSTYRGEETGEGGYVYSEPGMYENVALLDVASLHPTSMEILNIFGDVYTKRFSNIKQARVAVKHGDWEKADILLDGKLKPIVERLRKQGVEVDHKSMAFALKIPINSVYGLTSAKFENPFRDIRNKDNIVAKRGALFMIDLKHYVQELGYQVIHIKTDSIKIPNADDHIIQKVIEFGKKYGYDFEHEATYDRICLVNDAVYIAHDSDGWHATGAQFAEPYVYKTLFTREPVVFKDLCVTKSVQTALYLDFNEDLPEGEHAYSFVGKVGLFTPVVAGSGGGILLRKGDGDNYTSAAGTKGYRWKEADAISSTDKFEEVDMSYFNKLADDALAKISEFGDAEGFRA